ncbi:hypothetical protein [Chryseobacterium herbae]|uniref:Uncharacterized protein n=1 Tax=Chryseobacterium herbae TaxID=2976476 RepID=A0ABT2IYM0_9FLAO|nr:hypothetical protein [Chryseobacterium sp. pc1-10]MCT2563705.1 hypothetical protein [Chryseobacterium sp. pc1-10]
MRNTVLSSVFLFFLFTFSKGQQQAAVYCSKGNSEFISPVSVEKDSVFLIRDNDKKELWGILKEHNGAFLMLFHKASLNGNYKLRPVKITSRIFAFSDVKPGDISFGRGMVLRKRFCR